MRKSFLFSAREWLADKTIHSLYPAPRLDPVRKVSAADNQPLRLVWKNPMPGFMRLALGLLGLFWWLVAAVVLSATIIFTVGALWGAFTGG
ncbi:hypothetical protein [Paraburkholderia diazotrophica]|uniref:hypothetical protein n=1 Tax=Paraburkholderia diazotrophica TaxID=667676 RepID=UPI0031774A2B